jgi:hypothetical protein
MSAIRMMNAEKLFWLYNDNLLATKKGKFIPL